MKQIAAEMNLSETAYVYPSEPTAASDVFTQGSHFGLRWFTPTREVPLCGHATLCTAASLFIQQSMEGWLGCGHFIGWEIGLLRHSHPHPMGSSLGRERQ